MEADGEKKGRVLGDLRDQRHPPHPARRAPPDAPRPTRRGRRAAAVEAHAGRAEVRNVQGGCRLSVTLPTA
ncbi:hypothetical protein RB201_01345 [Streptomyces sp. S1A(2023)]